MSKPFDQDAFEHIQNSSASPEWLALNYGITKQLVNEIQMGHVKTFVEAHTLAMMVPRYLVRAELRASSREEAARWLQEMADTLRNQPTFRFSMTAGLTWSVELGPGVSEHERQG